MALSLALLLHAGTGPARAEDVSGLYDGRTIVTGQGEENRAAGAALCFSDVLAKVSGDFTILDRAPPEGGAAEAMTRFSYHDRMAGLPLHDEEGTRRRPYDLTVGFDPGKVDAALRALGASPWTAPRPRIVAFVAITAAKGSFLLASDGEAGYGQRDAMRDAAWQVGLPVRLPDQASFARDGLSAADAADGDLGRLDLLARRGGGDVALAGSLSWSDEAILWTGRWRLSFGGRSYAWDNRAESFDGAYRGAMRGAGLVLSGHATGSRFTVP